MYTDLNKPLGYIKLNRDLLHSPIFSNSNLWHTYTWCLMRANHKERTIIFNDEEITLKRGDFITGTNAGADELLIKPGKFYFLLQKLKKLKIIAINVESRFSIITVLKYDEFQNNKEEVESRLKDDRKMIETDKNVKNVKNGKNVKNTGDLNLPIIENINFESYKHLNDKVFRDTWSEFKDHRVQIKKRLSVAGENKSLKYLDEFQLNTATKMLEQSIRNGWQGIFELKNNQMRGTQSGTVNHSGLKEWAKENGVDFNF